MKVPIRWTDSFDLCFPVMPARVDHSQHDRVGISDFFCAFSLCHPSGHGRIDLCPNTHQFENQKKIVDKTTLFLQLFAAFRNLKSRKGLRITAQKEIWCQSIANQQKSFYCIPETVSVFSFNRQRYDEGNGKIRTLPIE